MKKRILTLVLMLSIGFSSVFANNEEGISMRAVSAFKREFTQVKDVKWEAGKEFVKATFEMNGQVMFAYYTLNGEQLAVCRNILSTQLPFNLASTIRNQYKQSWITDLFEMASHGDTIYYVTLETADSKVILKSNGMSGWEQFKKEKKNTEE